MSAPRRFSVLAVLLPLVLGAAGDGRPTRPTPGPSGPREFEPPHVEIVVDLVRAHDGRIPVSMTVEGLYTAQFAFTEPVKAPEYRYHDVRFFDGQGRRIAFTRKHRQYLLRPFEGSIVEARYEAQPGGKGRHGLQGIATQDFATFDGRLYLLPKYSRRLRSARIRFVLPEGWTVASPFRREGEWHYLDAFEPAATALTLAGTCVGVGRFDHTSRGFGETEVRVATYSDWEQAHKKALVKKTYRLHAYFHETLGFDLQAPVSVVWTPKHERQRVFGGASANANCFDHPVDSPSNWRLLGHRLGHAMNKYPPSGMDFLERDDRWFREGWASYVEVRSTLAAGIAEDESFFNSLYGAYKSGRKRAPERDIAMADEPSARGDTEEYIHYRKSPLVVRMLDHLMTARSGRTMDQFMAAMWNKYGWFRSSMPVKQELEAFTGDPFDDFWRMLVEQPGVVVPVWADFITPEIRSGMKGPPAARVGGAPLSGDYLHYLAASGDFANFEAIRDFLVQEQMRRRVLEFRDVELYPDEIREHLFALPAEDRYAIARLEASYPLQFAPYRSDLSDAPAPETVELVLDTHNEDGRVFSELLALESDYDSAISSGDLAGIVVQAGEASTRPLGFASNAALRVGSDWRSPPATFEIDVLVGGEATKSLTVTVESESRPTWSALLRAAERPDRDGIIAFRVRVDDETVATRAFWQRGREPERRRAPSDRRRRPADRSE